MAKKIEYSEGKLKELKIALLKQPGKRKGIKREIARLLTVKQNTEKKKQ